MPVCTTHCLTLQTWTQNKHIFLVRVFGASEIKRIHKHQTLQNAIYTCLKMKHHTDTHVPLGTGTSISCPFAAQGTGLTKRPMTPPTWTKTRMIPCDKLDTQLSEVCRGKKKNKKYLRSKFCSRAFKSSETHVEHKLQRRRNWTCRKQVACWVYAIYSLTLEPLPT